MALDFKKFNEAVDLEELAEAVNNSENNKSEYEKVPHGTYEVKIDNLEMKESKNGKLMMSVWFKILEGEQKSKLIFAHYMLEHRFGIIKAKEMLEQLSGSKDIKFKDYEAFNDVILDTFEKTSKYEYALEYKANDKKPEYDDFKITEVFEIE